jgi:hypothetical protein
MTFEDWKCTWPEDTPMQDIYDGWGWRAVEAGLKSRKGGKWGMEDVKVTNLGRRFVSLPCGLLFAFNIDWCVVSSVIACKY